MSANPHDLDHLPPEASAWLAEHRKVTDLIAAEAISAGEWPSVAQMTRALVRRGEPVALRALLDRMPRALGYLDHSSDRIVLGLFALRRSSAGAELVDRFIDVLRIAADRFEGPDEHPTLTACDVTRVCSGPQNRIQLLKEIVLREAPFLGSGGASENGEWHREITDAIVRYWNVRTADGYLRIRAAELATSPLAGFSVRQATTPATAQASQPDDEGHLEKREVFISHASEDKDPIARPLAEELVRRGRSVWFDEHELLLGDSLSGKIDEGLRDSTVGVVILSHAFFAKRWTRRELDGLTARLVGGEPNVILPIWHGITASDLLRYSPPLADLLAADSSEGLARLANGIERVLNRRAAQSPARPPTHVNTPSGQTAPSNLPPRHLEGSLLIDPNGEAWMIAGGARFRAPDKTTVKWLYPHAAVRRVTEEEMQQIPTIPRDGTLLREEPAPVFLIAGGAKLHVPDPWAFDRLFRGAQVSNLWTGALDDLPTTPRDGTLLRQELDDCVYEIRAGIRHVVDGDVDRVPMLWRGALDRFPLAS